MKTTIYIFLLFVAMLSVCNADAQTWQRAKHHDYICAALAPDYEVIAAKDTDAGGHEMVRVKFKIPYRYDISTAYAKITQIDLNSGNRSTQDTFISYKNGWAYLGHYLYNGKPCYTYIVTVYKDNDWGRSGGESTRFNLHLETLTASQLSFSEKHFETHW